MFYIKGFSQTLLLSPGWPLQKAKTPADLELSKCHHRGLILTTYSNREGGDFSINLQNSFKNINFNVLILFVELQQQKHYAICCFEIARLTK